MLSISTSVSLITGVFYSVSLCPHDLFRSIHMSLELWVLTPVWGKQMSFLSPYILTAIKEALEHPLIKQGRAEGVKKSSKNSKLVTKFYRGRCKSAHYCYALRQYASGQGTILVGNTENMAISTRHSQGFSREPT